MINKKINTVHFKDFRNPKTNSLLCRAVGKGQIEIVDRKTRETIYTGPNRKHNDIGLKGIDFQRMSRDLRCSSCNRLLARGLGYKMYVEIRCNHCKTTSMFGLEELYEKFFATLPIRQKENLKLQIKNLTF